MATPPAVCIGGGGKMTIALCKGKRLHDKRDSIRERDNRRDLARISITVRPGVSSMKISLFDRSLVTRAETTLPALGQALSVLRAGGLSMSEMADIARRVCEEDLNVTSEVQTGPSDPWDAEHPANKTLKTTKTSNKTRL